jgi:hypothetical protein
MKILDTIDDAPDPACPDPIPAALDDPVALKFPFCITNLLTMEVPVPSAQPDPTAAAPENPVAVKFPLTIEIVPTVELPVPAERPAPIPAPPLPSVLKFPS